MTTCTESDLGLQVIEADFPIEVPFHTEIAPAATVTYLFEITCPAEANAEIVIVSEPEPVG